MRKNRLYIVFTLLANLLWIATALLAAYILALASNPSGGFLGRSFGIFIIMYIASPFTYIVASMLGTYWWMKRKSSEIKRVVWLTQVTLLVAMICWILFVLFDLFG